MDFDTAVGELTARGPGRMIPDLERITALLELLGDPQLAYPSIHVTGTNGKGSVARMVSALVSAVGLTAGTYTSPHLQTIRERLTVAGRHVSEGGFAALFEEIVPFADLVDETRARERERAGQAPDHVTFFELLTAMASSWFADVPVDVGVFEVGMGGRWDATNLVRGDVAVINAVDLDHAELGGTLTEVAREKAGIVKPGAVVVTAAQAPDVLDVVTAAARANDATLWRSGDEVAVVDRRIAVGGQQLALRVGERVVEDIFLPLHGAHQADNAVLALAAAAALLGSGWHQVDDDLVRQGFLAVSVPGRLEVVNRDPTVVLDGAHNPHGARAAAAAIAEAFGFRTLVLVAACLDDKDVAGILGPFSGVVSHVVVTEAPSGRAAPLERMRREAQEVWAGTTVAVETAPDVPAALDLAAGLVGPGDGILVAGSLYTVGAARDRFLPVADPGDEVVREPIHEDDAEDEAAFQTALDEMIDGLGAARDGRGDDGADGN